MSNYPNNLDNDASMPQIADEVTEITADSINPIRDAVLLLEQYVGTNPQGNKPDLNSRISVSIDENGNIKASALNGLGLVTLPIYDNEVAPNAGIQESKLALNFGTSFLNNRINVVSGNIGTLQTAIATVGGQLSTHIIGGGYNHDGYSIFVNKALTTQYGIGGLSATNIGDAVNQLAGILVGGTPSRVPHINLSLPSTTKHQASEISIDTENFIVIDKSVSTVQEAFDSLDENQGAFGREHVKGFHSNGIFKVVTSGDGYSINYPLIINSAAQYTAGSSIVTFASQVSTLGIKPGDIFVLPEGLDAGQYQINAIGPITPSQIVGDLPTLDAYQFTVFYVFENTAAELASVYKSATVSSNFAPLATAVRSNETGPDSITILNPNSATAVSLGFNAAIINGDGYNLSITVGVGDGYTRTATIPNLNLYRLMTNQANPVSSKSVAERINAYVSDPTIGLHFPISAFPVGNEIAIAHNLVGPEYTLEILDGYSANFALGFDSFGANLAGKVILGNINDDYTVNGKTLSTIRTVFDGYATSLGANTFYMYDSSGNLINPYNLGIQTNDILHVINHASINANGSYDVSNTTTTTISTFENIPAGTFNVLITDSNISLEQLNTTSGSSSTVDAGIMQFFINEFGRIETYQRASYNNAFGFGPGISVAAVSNSFPPGITNINVQVNPNSITFNTVNNSISGETVTVAPGFTGAFNLYHYNNTEYFTIFIQSGMIISVNVAVNVLPFPNIDEVLLLATAHFDNSGQDIDFILDNRLFGTMGAEHIRNDFIEIFSQRPVEELRSDGVANGFDILPLPQYDSSTGIPALPLSGGVAYVQGVRVAVNTQKVLVPAFDSLGNSLSGTFVVAINNLGTIATYNMSLSEMLVDGYSTSVTYGKLLPLYQIVFSGSAITNIIDVRSFINNVDNKLDIIVENNGNNLGNFKDLAGALTYISEYPTNERLNIKIINQVNITTPLIVPAGVTITGSSLFGKTCAIVNNTGSTGPLLTLLGNNTLENISVSTNLPGLNQALVLVDGYNTRIENCSFSFAGPVPSGLTNTTAISLAGNSNNITIKNNIIDMVFRGIVVNDGATNISIENNSITNVSGIGGQISSGIYFQNPTIKADNVKIIDNSISIPYVTPDTSDIRAMYFNIGAAVGSFKIEGNQITNTAFTNSNLVGVVTYGIHLENNAATTNTIQNLIISKNNIRGVKSNGSDNWGIYVGLANDLIISENTIKDVGVDGYDGSSVPMGFCYLGASVIKAHVVNNIFQDGYTDIGVSALAGLSNINNNIVNNIGNLSTFVSGDGYNSIVSNNILTGPGNYGVLWNGKNSQINNNNLNGPENSYAFGTAGIAAAGQNINTNNNSLSQMYSSGSIGITNLAATNINANIENNSVYGSNMASLVQIFGADHNVAGNKLYNLLSSGSTTFIETDGVTKSLISNNHISGNALYGINAPTLVIDSTSIVNNNFSGATFSGTVSSIPITGRVFSLLAATNCLVQGNTLPYYYSATPYGTTSAAPSQNIIGPSLGPSVANTNTIGINKNLLDTLPINIIDGLPDNSSGTQAWMTQFSGAAMYWTQTTPSSSSAIYFPINNLPNGSVISSIQLTMINPSTQFYISVVKRGNDGSFVITPVTSLPSSSSVQSIYELLSTPIVVNNNFYNYYVYLTATSTSSAVQLYSLSVNFQY